MSEIREKIAQANKRLKTARVGVKIEQIGDRLTLRATLPPKPGSDKTKDYQQRIYLGIHANLVGLKESELQAKKIGALLDCGEFDWQPYLSEIHHTPVTAKVWACYPEWVEQFDLNNPKIPQVTGRNNSELGSRISHAFKRYGIPFTPYDLRHCWAVRTLEFGLADSLAAQQMGHSVQVHNNLYHAWIDQRHHQRAYNLIMERSDRPKPPEV